MALAVTTAVFPELPVNLWKVADHTRYHTHSEGFDVADGQHELTFSRFIVHPDIVGASIKYFGMLEAFSDFGANPVPLPAELFIPWPPNPVKQ